MKINAWKTEDCSRPKEEFKLVSSFEEWRGTEIFSEHVRHSFIKADYEDTVPSNFCTVNERYFLSQFQKPPPDGNLNSGGWMTKWRNRTKVKFSRARGKQGEDYVGNNMGGVRKVELTKCGRKSKCAHGIESLLMALEYIEMQDRLQQQLFEKRTECQRNEVVANQSITDDSGIEV